MKRLSLVSVISVGSLLLSGCSTGIAVRFNPWVLIPLFFTVLTGMIALVGTKNYRRYVARKRRQHARRRDILPMNPMLYVMYAIAIIGIILTVVLCLAPKSDSQTPTTNDPAAVTTTSPTTEPAGTTDIPPSANGSSLTPTSSASSDPATWGITWEIFENNAPLSDYNRSSGISFEDASSYFALPGLGAFRGDNYRTGSTYGTAEITDKTLTQLWSTATGKLTNADGTTWTGSGWTGQPLLAQWPTATRRMMNLYDHKQQKDGLVEVIYATLDGCIYFLDLDDGSYTRDPLRINMPFKGSGSLDPRGYPLLYVGSGDENSAGDHPRMYIISLIDGSVLYEGGFNDPLSLRKDNDNWSAFDSSPLVCTANDTLIWAGENGLLYTMRLNTFFDAIGGTISISPASPVIARYNTSRSNEETYWYGYEASPVIVDHYLYISENGGMFYCIDLNTMKLVWAQDTKDDSNASPVFEAVSDSEGYVYTAPSLHWTAESGYGTISLYKLNAVTGDIVWEKPYDVHTVSGVSGGVQASPLLGKKGTTLENTVVYAIARTPGIESGILVALDTATGDECWRLSMEHYAWSSPVAVYTNDGTGYILIGDSAGYVKLVNGATGEAEYTISVGTMIEATPAVFNNRVVIGTKCQTIRGLEIR